MPRQPHHAFRIEGQGLLPQLVCQVGLCATDPQLGPTTPQKFFNLLWDTGATASVITPEVALELGLIPTGQRRVGAAGATHEAKTYLVDLFLPMGARMRAAEVCALSIPGGMHGLIGMDVINVGDFSISNFGGKTVFTFALPPFENRTDLLEKANHTNRRR